MKGYNKVWHSLLAHLTQDQYFQHQQLLLPVKLHPLAQQQQQFTIYQQQQLATHNNLNGGQLFWPSQSPAEATIARYTNPGRNNNSDKIRTVFTSDGVCFVENNGRQILNKWNFLVRRGEKAPFLPFLQTRSILFE